MSPAVDELLQCALTLSDEELRELATELVSAIDVRRLLPLDNAWLAEIERRSAEFDAGSVVARPWREVKERAKRQ